MLEPLEPLDELAGDLQLRARQDGMRFVWRGQSRLQRHVAVQKGRVESSGVSRNSGQGLQLIGDDGATVLGSQDDLRPERAPELWRRLRGMVAASGPLGLDRGRWPALPPIQAQAVPDGLERFEQLDHAELGRRLIAFEQELIAEVPDVSMRLGLRFDVDAWRLFREDGTDVRFAMPRCVAMLRATARGAQGQSGIYAALASSTPDLFERQDFIDRFRARCLHAARLSVALGDAPPFPAGSHPLVIDYALAKGLAHEAFGHAAEADGFRSSVLAREGKLRRGDAVGPEYVSIIDEPVPEDHAWQPFSSNGLPRRPVRIVDAGKLHEGLSDPWSAELGGVPLSGAARQESFRNAPQPRMTNIRIEVANPRPAPGPFEAYGPEQVRSLLADAGVFRRHKQVAFLSGYNGGQVNPTSGDFVFNCKAIYALTESSATLHRPAIFSGSMFGALKNVREAFGPLLLDALGYCGKWGQSVPSSGGSHYFVVIDPDPSVRLGGGN